MKASFLLRFGLPLLLLSPALAQTTAPKTEAKPAPAAEAPAAEAQPVPQLRGMEKLTDDQRKTLLSGMAEVSNYVRGVRNLEALDKLNEIEQTVGPTHLVENMRGAVYTKMRDFAKARVHFKKALDLSKGLNVESFHPKFNLAELDFVEAGNNAAKLREVPPRQGVDPAAVQKQWAVAHESFTKLLKDDGLTDKDTTTLVNFKLFICNVMMKRPADADVVFSGFDKFDANSPAYYYALAVQEFVKEDKEKAQEWLDSAKRIYPKETNEVFNDALVEMGWLETLQ